MALLITSGRLFMNAMYFIAIQLTKLTHLFFKLKMELFPVVERPFLYFPMTEKDSILIPSLTLKKEKWGR
jgi:hypothetical protein